MLGLARDGRDGPDPEPIAQVSCHGVGGRLRADKPDVAVGAQEEVGGLGDPVSSELIIVVRVIRRGVDADEVAAGRDEVGGCGRAEEDEIQARIVEALEDVFRRG